MERLFRRYLKDTGGVCQSWGVTRRPAARLPHFRVN
jgi:hypothetical protein